MTSANLNAPFSPSDSINLAISQLRSELSEVSSQTIELSMNHAAALIEIAALRRTILEAHQLAIAHHLYPAIARLEMGWPELAQQREVLAPHITFPIDSVSDQQDPSV